MEVLYTVQQNVPGHPVQVVQTGLSHGDARDLAERLKAASPEVLVSLVREQEPTRKRGRRG